MNRLTSQLVITTSMLLAHWAAVAQDQNNLVEVYRVRLGVFETAVDAERLVAELGPKFRDIGLEKKDTRDKSVYEVSTGYFEELEDAEKGLALALDLGASAVILSESIFDDERDDSDEVLIQPQGSGRQRASTLTRRPDDKRPENQFTVDLFGRPLTIGGEFGSTTRERKDFRLADQALDDLVRFDQGVQLEFFYPINTSTFLFMEGKAEYEYDIDAENNREDSEFSVARGESWVYFANLWSSDFSLQVGRQHFRDKREWWWDNELDAIRVHYDRESVHAELSIAQEVTANTAGEPIDPLHEDVFRVLGSLVWEWTAKQRIEVYAITQNDHSGLLDIGESLNEDLADEADGNLTWFGLRARGRWKIRRFKSLNRIYYWLDYGFVTGDQTVTTFQDIGDDQLEVDTNRDSSVRGWGADVGLTWQSRWAWKPRLTIGYAYGSGDRDAGDDRNRAFQQTGLQDNNGKFRGVDRFRYYGELLRPELSNLKIATIALGVPFFTNSSFEIVFHEYQQVYAAPTLRRTRINAPLTGLDSDVGKEFDLVIGLEEWPHVEIEIVAALFEAGSAFGLLEGELARNIILKMDYNF